MNRFGGQGGVDRNIWGVAGYRHGYPWGYWGIYMNISRGWGA